MLTAGMHEGMNGTCVATNNTAWVVNVGDGCILNHESYNVTVFRYVGTGMLQLTNGSVVQYQDSSQYATGPLQVFLTQGSVVRGRKT
jgi:hypothetical protein